MFCKYQQYDCCMENISHWIRIFTFFYAQMFFVLIGLHNSLKHSREQHPNPRWFIYLIKLKSFKYVTIYMTHCEATEPSNPVLQMLAWYKPLQKSHHFNVLIEMLNAKFKIPTKIRPDYTISVKNNPSMFFISLSSSVRMSPCFSQIQRSIS